MLLNELFHLISGINILKISVSASRYVITHQTSALIIFVLKFHLYNSAIFVGRGEKFDSFGDERVNFVQQKYCLF